MRSLLDDEPSLAAQPASAKRQRRGVMETIRGFLDSGGGKALVGVLFVAIILFVGVRFFNVAKSRAPIYNDVRYMHIDTQEMRWYKIGQRPPEGFYPVEYCFNNQCGPDGGTPVILNAYVGRPGPTKCPKCDAPVTAHNPRPDGYETTIPADWSRR